MPIVEALSRAALETLILTVTVAPYFLLGAVTGAALQAWLSPKWSAVVFGGTGLRPLVNAVTVAAVLPGCSCATMPMAAGLKVFPAPRLGTLSAFVFTSPLLSPVTVVLTLTMLGWQLAVGRVVASLAGGVLLGILINAMGARLHDAAGNGHIENAAACCETDVGAQPIQGSTLAPTSRRFRSSLYDILRSITPYFLLGMAIAGIATALVPEGSIPRYLGGASGPLAYTLALVVGIPLYVCEGEEVPITYALLEAGLGPGPSLTFLLGSVGTCIPTVVMARSVIGRRATMFYAGFWLLFALSTGLVFDMVMGSAAGS
ncbi:MAG: permease [Acidobacteria bacterium]|nr:permease [Acidobacteriota bacterium]